ncbi:hypothetical protein L228DRAFT_263743 [Xylona heveae TC161]|uniref:tRNA-splicing endonuclease subunit Sen54 N-terminal domain-containing protein n=1 Tax=Xylona heveae (strain CBS 132557 / TC161) TaxID=1328760 RepID=A0A164ZRC2_XYLHT|nr:hypothetical protein L228DRAFT_263743 [Xylona heveae TC161]KZF19412.1 hypothetical protein L228DRAFT_263743 [Xylona heveae TC161]
MADADEDVVVFSGQGPPGEIDLSDETQDFRFLQNFSQDPDQGKIPKRGVKDFEPHGTSYQESVLAASRQAMHNALNCTRTHAPKSHIIGYYHPETNLTRVSVPKGPHFKNMGKADRSGHIWLLPEEALYLIERGNLDMRWPKTEHDEGVPGAEDGLPMSLQGAYAAIFGFEEELGGALTLERYLVYAGLKRCGFAVIRADSWDCPGEGEFGGGVYDPPTDAWSSGLLGMFTRLFSGLWWGKNSAHAHWTPSTSARKLGPLVKPGLYRSYNDIYRLLSVIPAHDPTIAPPRPKPVAKSDSSSITDGEASRTGTTDPPFRVAYHIYKPTPSFKKSAPGPPDFRIAVVNARETTLPTLPQIAALVESTPYCPPPASMHQSNQKLRYGYRNVVLAIVDNGVVSYMRIGDAGFAQERLFERFDAVKAGGGGRGNKRGGGRGGGRGGRGRGRGRGR